MSNERKLRSCAICGVEFMGFNGAKYCPDCAAGRQQDNSPERELADEKDGWRHMLRDDTGTVIVPGGNVICALDDLCAYEEACEAAGIHGPEELAEALKELKRLRSGGARCAPLQNAEGREARPLRTERTDGGWYDPHALRPRWTQGKHCEGCGHYHPTIASGARGICDAHPRRVRPAGGKGQHYILLDEPRQCQARRVACKDWTRRIETPAQPSPSTPHSPEGEGSGWAPEWVGPSAELLPEETPGTGRKEKTADKQCLSLQSESGGNS